MSPINPHNILRHELIGLPVKVSDATNPSIKGIRGAVVDETKNTLKIRAARGTVVVPKDATTFRFKLPDGMQVDVVGRRLVARPESRLKTKVRRW
jgi:ribonuclease P protein subunit POP4